MCIRDREYDACDRGTKKAAVIGVIVAVILETVFTLCSGWIMQLFSKDPDVYKRQVLW